MKRSVVVLSAVVFASTALLSLQPKEARSEKVVFNCFDRSSEKLIAHSAVDKTSDSISCLPNPGKYTFGRNNGDSFINIMDKITTREDDGTDYFGPLEHDESGLGEQISDLMEDKVQ